MTDYSTWLGWWWLIPLALMVACLLGCAWWLRQGSQGPFCACGCLPQERPDGAEQTRPEG